MKFRIPFVLELGGPDWPLANDAPATDIEPDIVQNTDTEAPPEEKVQQIQ